MPKGVKVAAAQPGWTVVLPVKAWALAKSRLALKPPAGASWAEAMALDVLDVVLAAREVANVIVVTSQPEMRAAAARRRSMVLTDRPLVDTDPLNTAIRIGAAGAAGRHWSAPLVVVPSDLATLTPEVLDATLRMARQSDRAFVSDVAGGGTTLLMARRPELLRPAFGPHSAARHRAMGCVDLDGVDIRARLDVDTVADLQRAHDIGLGRRAGALSRHVGEGLQAPSAR